MTTARDYSALVAYLEARARYRFAFRPAAGHHDCVRFAAGAVQAQTGENPLKGLTWRSAKAARAMLEDLGGLSGAVSSKLADVPVGMAQRGDIGLIDLDGRESLCVIEGEMVVAAGVDRLVRLPRSAMTKAWSAQT
jgi:hypothetical protein